MELVSNAIKVVGGKYLWPLGCSTCSLTEDKAGI